MGRRKRRRDADHWWSVVRRFWERWTGRVRRAELVARMQPGDVVVASPRLRRLSPIALAYRLLLRSRTVHSMLYLGGDRMIHTTSRDGVVVGRLPRKVFDGQRYAVYRVPGLDDAQRARIVTHARAQLERRVDHLSLASNIPSRWLGLRRPLVPSREDRLWCSRLIVEAYRVGAGVDLVPDVADETVVTEDIEKSPVVERV